MSSDDLNDGAGARRSARLKAPVLEADNSDMRSTRARALLAAAIVAALWLGTGPAARGGLGRTAAQTRGGLGRTAAQTRGGLGRTAAQSAASDLEASRRRAQMVASRVSALERRLQSLRGEQAALGERVVAATQRIVALEAELGDTREALARARHRYVSRAVEAYKDGPNGQLALLLSAQDPADLLDIAEASSRAAQADQRSLQGLLESLEARAAAQDEIDDTKQELLRAQAEAAAVASGVEDALAERRTTLAQLHAEIERLQEQARRAALRAAQPDEAFARLLQSAGPAPDVPAGYVGTGVVFEGIASWYGPGFKGETTANGQVFDPRLYTAASRDLAFGTVLHVTHEGAGVVVVINDRGPFIKDRILDLSRAAAEAIGLGLGWVRAEIVVPG